VEAVMPHNNPSLSSEDIRDPTEPTKRKDKGKA
jgi:hypothetical protein